MYLLYGVALPFAAVLALPYFLWKGRRDGRYRATFRERWDGPSPSLHASETPSIWIHAVSVGEAVAAGSLVPALRQRFPDHPVFVSTTTMTGQQIARRIAGAAGSFYAPFDWPPSLRRTLARIRPALLVIVDTELWPHTLRETRRYGAKIALVNGRISDRSYPRYRTVRRLFRRALAQVDLFLMQGPENARRMIAIGADADRVAVVGSLKYDAVREPAPDSGLRAALGDGPWWIAGSTTAGEESQVLAAYRRARERHPRLRLLIAPRHPERFPEVETAIAAGGYRCVRRTALAAVGAGTDAVILLDSVGELADVYAIATVAFVGGSLVPRGGHNILEAAAAGVPVVVGPHMENFPEIAAAFRSAGAFIEVRDAQELGQVVSRLVGDSSERSRLVRRGIAVLARERGALDRTVDHLAALLA